MSVQEMKALRERAGLTQAQMAERMGLGKTAYVDLELGDPDWKKFKDRHLLALERVSLKLAVERGDIGLALPSVRQDAKALMALSPLEASEVVLRRLEEDIAKIERVIERDISAGIPSDGGGWKSILHTRQQRAAMLRDAVRQWRLDEADAAEADAEHR